MESALEETIGPYRVEVWYDDFPHNPFKDWDGMPTLVHWHRRYDLGERYPENFPHPFEQAEEALAAIRAEYGCTVILPVYLYDHSGITVSTKPFHCPWDSGQVGFIFYTPEALNIGWGDKPPTDEALPEIIASALETYDRYLTGQVYGYTVEGPDGLHESCGGFFDEPEEVMKEAMAYVEDDVVAEYERVEKLKADYPDMQNIVIN